MSASPDDDHTVLRTSSCDPASAVPADAASPTEAEQPDPEQPLVAPPGPPSHGGIAILPPIKPTVADGYPVSPRTGEPQRPWLLTVAVSLLLLGSVVAGVGLLQVLWDAATVTGYHAAARVLSWVQPDPVSWLTLILVLTIGLIGVLIVGAPASAAYNAWNGDGRTRWLGLTAVGVCLLSILLNTTALVALVPVTLGAALLWLAPISSYVSAWSQVRHDQHAVTPQWVADVFYGPLPRYRV